MRRSSLALALVSAIALTGAGCASATSALGSLTSGVPAVANSACATAPQVKQAWSATLTVYIGLTNAYTAGVNGHVLTLAQVNTIEPLRLQGVSIRKAGSDAYDLCNATNLGAQITALKDIVGKLTPLIPVKPK